MTPQSQMAIWKIFTDEARRALLRAQDEAMRRGALSVTVDDLARGIVLEPCLQKHWWLRLLSHLMLSRATRSQLSGSPEWLPRLSPDLARSISRIAHSGSATVPMPSMTPVPMIGLKELCDATCDHVAPRTRCLIQIANWLLSPGMSSSIYGAFKASIAVEMGFARLALACGLLMVFLTGIPWSGKFGLSPGLATGLVLLTIVFPLIVFHSLWRQLADFRDIVRLFALSTACLAIMFPVSISLMAPRTVTTMEWIIIISAAVLAGLPITAISVMYHFPNPTSVNEQMYGMAMSYRATEEHVTDEAIMKWQSEGLMPEVRRGHILVWKSVSPRMEPGGQQARPARYLGFLEAEYQIDRSYHYPYSMVCAGPLGALKGHVDVGQSGHLLAILARKNVLESEMQSGVFFAHIGRPVAAYRAHRTSEDTFEYTLLEGTDAMRWIGGSQSRYHSEQNSH